MFQFSISKFVSLEQLCRASAKLLNASRHFSIIEADCERKESVSVEFTLHLLFSFVTFFSAYFFFKGIYYVSSCILLDTIRCPNPSSS